VKKDSKTSPAAAIDYNIAQLLKQPTGEGREYVLNEDLTGLDDSLVPEAPLTGKIKLVRTKNGVLLSLDGTARLRVSCSRCLDPVAVPVTLRFEEEFLQTIDVTTGSALGASHEDPSILIDGHHDLHLADIVREYLLTEAPMHALCREDCKGLCPTCGRNLNLGPCSCEKQNEDERWAALKQLL
jgi:uncharacterized protein